MLRGIFITFEGIDGCGKTTQLNLLADWLKQRRVDFVITREPGSTPVGDGIRSILLDSKTTHLTPIGEVLLYYASRIQNVEQVIRPALNRGKMVFCDRFHDASWAYQGFGRQLGIEFMKNLDDLVLDGFHPDHTILIEIDIETSIQRAKVRNTNASQDENRFELEAREFFERVAAG
ncbi:MAG: dTMP kinase, partial [Acidobacteriia bacterium]|nr:dTMP kinase [Terriglobia bacterium]